jgi:hypothetical protein
MKKLKIFLLIAVLACLITACHFGKGHTTILETGTNYYLKIEYWGYVHFTNDGKAISSISPGGYVKYQFNHKKLEAKNNGTGGVSYEIYDYDEKLDPNRDGKPLIAEAVRMMIRKGYHPERK